MPARVTRRGVSPPAINNVGVRSCLDTTPSSRGIRGVRGRAPAWPARSEAAILHVLRVTRDTYGRGHADRTSTPTHEEEPCAPSTAYGATSATARLSAMTIERRDLDTHDVLIDIALLRHLPLRHPPGPRRVGRRPPTRWCPATRSSGRVARGRAPRSTALRRRRPRRRRLHGRLVPGSARPAAPATSSTAAKGNTAHLQRHREATATLDLRRLLDAHRRRPSASSLKIPEGLDLDARGAAPVRRHHHVLAAAPLEGGPGPERRRGGPRRARPHGGEARARAWAPR